MEKYHGVGSGHNQYQALNIFWEVGVAQGVNTSPLVAPKRLLPGLVWVPRMIPGAGRKMQGAGRKTQGAVRSLALARRRSAQGVRVSIGWGQACPRFSDHN